ncbi:MAG: nucleotidyl transferase AbiEii/AbiGii toxin family protein [Thermoleophilaceae bacterium]
MTTKRSLRRRYEVSASLSSPLYLGGGTALAVHIAHRVSLDLDFFYHELWSP